MTVDPSVVTLLRENTRTSNYVIQVSLSDANLSALLTIKTFELVPGIGEPRKVCCCARRKSPAARAGCSDTDPDSTQKVTVLMLVSRSFFTACQVERVVFVAHLKGVLYRRHRASASRTGKGDSKFVVNSRVDVKVELDGVEFLGASASEWINGGIRILPGDKGEMKASYPLYANLEKALENSLSDLPTTTVI